MRRNDLEILWRLFIFAALGIALCSLVRAADLPTSTVSTVEWRLVVNSENPAGPGRWIHSPLASPVVNPAGRNSAGKSFLLSASTSFAIKAGERVVLEEAHGRVSYSLVGRALGSARVGEPLRMQLSGSNAPVVRVIALGAGRVGFPVQTLTAGVR